MHHNRESLVSQDCNELVSSGSEAICRLAVLEAFTCSGPRSICYGAVAAFTVGITNSKIL